MLRDDIKNIKSTRRDLRNFGLTVGVALLVVGGILWWLTKPAYPFFLGSGGFLVVLGLVLPGLLRPLQRVWMTLAVIMGWVMTRVILFLFFYVVFTLVGLIGRLLGKEFLSLKRRSGKESQWHVRERQPYEKKRTEMQF